VGYLEKIAGPSLALFPARDHFPAAFNRTRNESVQEDRSAVAAFFPASPYSLAQALPELLSASAERSFPL